MASTVYLLHFEPPYRHAGHYIGYTREESLASRLDRHRSGRGANLVRVAMAAGSTVTLARVWWNAPRNFELTLKRHGHGSRFCPCCSGGAAYKRGIVAKKKRAAGHAAAQV